MKLFAPCINYTWVQTGHYEGMFSELPGYSSKGTHVFPFTKDDVSEKCGAQAILLVSGLLRGEPSMQFWLWKCFITGCTWLLQRISYKLQWT